MTIRNTTPSAPVEAEFSLMSPIYEYDEHQAVADSDVDFTPASAPIGTATALTTGQSFRREEHQLITIPSSNVIIDDTPTTTTTVRTSRTTRPVNVEPIAPNQQRHEQPNNQSKHVRKYGMIVNRKNAHLPEPVLRFKQERKRRTAAASWTGGIVGFVFGGPIGAAAGAGVAYASAKSVGKRREHKIEQRYTCNMVPPEASAVPVQRAVVV